MKLDKQNSSNSSYGILKGKIKISHDFNDEDTEINKMFYGGDAIACNVDKTDKKLKSKNMFTPSL